MTKTRLLIVERISELAGRALEAGYIDMGTVVRLLEACQTAGTEKISKIHKDLIILLRDEMQVRQEKIELDPDDPFGAGEMIEEEVIESDEYLDTWMKDCGYDGKLVV